MWSMVRPAVRSGAWLMPTLLLGVLFAAAGCGKHLNPAWCAGPGHSDPACVANESVDAQPTGCTGNGDCPGTMCLPSGVCAGPDAMLYASPAGTGTGCTTTAKCSIAAAIDQATADRNAIVLDPGIYPTAIAINHSVQIIGHGATIEGASTGAAVTVTNDVTVDLSDLSITGATGSSGISCISGTLRARGLRITNNQIGVTSACALRLERSVISANVGGAIAVTAGSIDFHNNFIFRNGSPTLGRSANVVIGNGVSGQFVFNTVAYNDSKKNSTPGVDCNSPTVVLDGNLIADNTEKGLFNGAAQVSGTCDFTKSYTKPTSVANDIHWVDVSADFHLTAASTLALDIPGLVCDGKDDFDGDSRPLGGGCDYGADERMP